LPAKNTGKVLVAFEKGLSQLVLPRWKDYLPMGYGLTLRRMEKFYADRFG
jgi:hypothetical protein